MNPVNIKGIHGKFSPPFWNMLSLQRLRKDVAGKQDEMKKLSQDLETTEQLCSTLQKSYQEYCPDIRRQEGRVNNLRNRYTNVNNQLQER